MKLKASRDSCAQWSRGSSAFSWRRLGGVYEASRNRIPAEVPWPRKPGAVGQFCSILTGSRWWAGTLEGSQFGRFGVKTFIQRASVAGTIPGMQLVVASDSGRTPQPLS